MLFKDLKQQMMLPQKEHIINRTVNIRGEDLIVVGITSVNGENKLWMIRHDDCNDFEEEIEPIINRERMSNGILRETQTIHIKEIEIQGQKMTFNSSSSTRVCEDDYDLFMALQHFVEKGMSATVFDEYNTFDLILYSYDQNSDESFPIIDLSKKLDIKLQIAEESEQILTNIPITIQLDNNCNDKEYSFFDEKTDKKYSFYINKAEHYDIWEDADKHFDSEKMKKVIKESNISDEQLEEMKKDYYEIIEMNCPRGMDVVMIEYEAKDDIQLNFYLKEFLDAEIERCSSSKSGILMFRPDNITGPHGYRNRICMIKPVEKDFNGTIDIELFSWYKKIPEEIIELIN